MRTRKYGAMTAVALAAMLFPACVFQSLHSPRPEQPGDVSLGIHGGVGYYDGEMASGAVSGTFRVGVVDHMELGINAGTLGVDAAFKYGFMSYEDAFQVSAIASVGLWGWSIFDPTIGVLVGYNIADVVMPFLGYRQHFFVVPIAGMLGNAIVGLEIFVGDVVSFMFEWDLTVSFSDIDLEGEDYDFDIDIDGLSTINLGINFHF